MPRTVRWLLVLVTVVVGNVQATDETDAIRQSIAKLDPHVLPTADRDSQRSMISRYLRDRINKANQESSHEWSRIQSRDDWERFRRAKLELLAKSLSRQPFEPANPQITVTGSMRGEGFTIRNLVIQPTGRTVITANLYLPDPPRDSMPGILLSHSHHNPKHEGELQDMGMTWARAGCYVLVPDHLGHGERRQHPFQSAADFAGEFAVGRQDYYFRYDMSLQLYLVGESLMGWLAHDLMSCVDVLLSLPGIDSKRIILLGSVAGGGDPAAVTAALDERIACVVPFNFGGPQPESRYPLPADAETSFNYAGSGSWESTRNLSHSAFDGFLPWVIVGSIAPRRVIHAHEFAWDREHDPVWRRYEKIWRFYGDDVEQRLAFAHGQGTLTSKDPPGSHCNNIGVVHRQLIHEAFRKWFAIDVKPEDEYRNRRTREELVCLTDNARQEIQPKALHATLAAIADQELAAARDQRVPMSAVERRKLTRESWKQHLGDVEPPKKIQVREGSPHHEELDQLTITREIIESEPGILVPLMTLAARNHHQPNKTQRVVVRVSSEGIEKGLARYRDEITAELAGDGVVVLAEVRGTGLSGADSDRGPQGTSTAHSATHLMLGQTMLGAQLRDLRAVWRYSHTRFRDWKFVAHASGMGEPLAPDAPFSYPRRISSRPTECDLTGSLLVGLLALFEDDVDEVHCSQAAVSYRSALDSPFLQIPHDCIVPGVLQEVDLPDLLAALPPCRVTIETLVDGRGRKLLK